MLDGVKLFLAKDFYRAPIAISIPDSHELIRGQRRRACGDLDEARARVLSKQMMPRHYGHRYVLG
jgi:hypothetical protein